MGTPGTAAERLHSTFDFGGLAVQNYVYGRFPLGAEILDVGAGWGKYRNLLPDYENMDACEIHQPYVQQERLIDRYRRVFCADVTNPYMAARLGRYDLVIFGDVLEHLEIVSAQRVIREVKAAAVVVPFEYQQGVEEGNQYEIHLQPDLTEDVMAERYPELRCMEIEVRRDGAPDDLDAPDVPFKGFYVKEPDGGN